jgi:hypothetical protein
MGAGQISEASKDPKIDNEHATRQFAPLLRPTYGELPACTLEIAPKLGLWHASATKSPPTSFMQGQAGL